MDNIEKINDVYYHHGEPMSLEASHPQSDDDGVAQANPEYTFTCIVCGESSMAIVDGYGDNTTVLPRDFGR